MCVSSVYGLAEVHLPKPQAMRKHLFPPRQYQGTAKLFPNFDELYESGQFTFCKRNY